MLLVRCIYNAFILAVLYSKRKYWFVCKPRIMLIFFAQELLQCRELIIIKNYLASSKAFNTLNIFLVHPLDVVKKSGVPVVSKFVLRYDDV